MRIIIKYNRMNKKEISKRIGKGAEAVRTFVGER